MKILSFFLMGLLFSFLLPNFIYAQSDEFVTGTITLSDEYLVTDFEIPSSLVIGGEITDHKIYTDFNLLVLELNTLDDGQLTITLPRTIIDAILENGEDDEFFVLIDGTETEFEEIGGTSERTVTVSFPKGTQEIMIIGTTVIPEFNEMVVMVLGSSFLLIVILSKKINLSQIQKQTI